MEVNAELDKAFELIKKRFVLKLKNNLPLFEAGFLQLEQQKTPQNIKDIRMKMHKIAGSAQTFGFAQINQIAAKVERLLDRMIANEPLNLFLNELLNEFSFFLKEAKAIAPVPKKLTVFSKPQNITEPSQPKKFHVMVIDDDELVRDLLNHGLTQTNCEIIPIENGLKALKQIHQWQKNISLKPPDLIILDVNMPKISGFEVLHTLKADAKLKDIPVIMLTRRIEDESIVQSISEGAIDYITKPFEIAKLADRITKTLNRNNIRVLVADDDELICDLLKLHFKHMGFQVIVASNGAQALELIQSKFPHVVILDIMMPGIDGFAVIKKIQTEPKLADIPVVFLSVKNQQENIINGLENGAHDYITKPFDIDELSLRITGILQRTKQLEKNF